MTAIDNHRITVSDYASNDQYTSTGGVFPGDAFMGNTITIPGPFSDVEGRQEQNLGALEQADNFIEVPGQSTLHGVTEAYQAAVITQNTGFTADPATDEDVQNPSSIYSRAHQDATPQTIPITETITNDASGNPIRVDYSVKKPGETPLILKLFSNSYYEDN